jgi:hypothetical protein
MDLYYFVNMGCQVADRPVTQPRKENPQGLVVVSVDSFDSETFYFPPQAEPSQLPSVTITDLGRGTIHFSTLRS